MQKMLPIVVLAFALVFSPLADRIASAQTYPARTIQLIAVQGPGSQLDLVARILAEKSDAHGFPMVVVNREGAHGEIGRRACAEAHPDGYTLCVLGDGGAVVVPAAMTVARQQPAFADMTAVDIVADVTFGLVVRKGLPGNLTDFIEYAKAHPEALACGSANPWGTLGIAMLNAINGVKVREIPYSGGEPNIYIDLAAGRIDCTFSTLTTARPFVDSGAASLLGTIGSNQSNFSADVRPLSVQGYGTFGQFSSWTGVFGPAGIPNDIVDSLNRDLGVILKDPGVVSLLEQNVMSVHKEETPEQLRKFIDGQFEAMKVFLCRQKVTILGYACAEP